MHIRYPPLVTVTNIVFNLVFPLNVATDEISSNVTRSDSVVFR